MSARKAENGFVYGRIVSSPPPRRNIRAGNVSNFNDCWVWIANYGGRLNRRAA
jgi:hypothetical protein